MRDLRYLVGMSQRARRALAHRWVGVFRWPEELDSWRLAKRRYRVGQRLTRAADLAVQHAAPPRSDETRR